MESDLGSSISAYNSGGRRSKRTGTVYHDNTVQKPQNICPMCGKSFLFQMQLRVHLATHDDDEEEQSECESDDAENPNAYTDNVSENKATLSKSISISASNTERLQGKVLHIQRTDSSVKDSIEESNSDVSENSEFENMSGNLDATDFQDSVLESDIVSDSKAEPWKSVINNSLDQATNDTEQIEVTRNDLEEESADEGNHQYMYTLGRETAKDDENADDNTMELDYGTTEELNDTREYTENDVNVEELNDTSQYTENDVNVEELNDTSEYIENDVNVEELNDTREYTENDVNVEELNDTSQYTENDVNVEELNDTSEYIENDVNVKELNDTSEYIENDVNVEELYDTSKYTENDVNVEELNDTSEYIENDVNLGEVIDQIKEEEETLEDEHLDFVPDNPDAEVIVINKDIGKVNRKPHISKLRYECPICEVLFQWPYQLKRHVNIHSGNYPYQCDTCGKKFDRSSSLRDHAMVHREDRPFECEVCGVKFTLKNNLNKHMNRHTQKKIWKCEHCKKPFLQRDQLIAHLIVHKGERPFPCEVCGKAFARKTNLKEHMITHSTEKNYPCDFCHKTFNKPYSKKIHMRHHLNTKPHKCDVCGASFSQSCALKTHIRRHTGERPFSCPMCPKSFAQQSTLQTHVAIHTGERNYKCGVCSRAFMRKRCLTEHMRLHTGEKPFGCLLCDFTTATKIGLKRHTETHVKQLIRNADIDFSKLGDFSPLSETLNGEKSPSLEKDSTNENDLSMIEKVKLVDRKLKLKNDANHEDNSTSLQSDGLDSKGEKSLDFEENGAMNDSVKASSANIEVQNLLEAVQDDAAAESLVYHKGLDLIVSEMNKLCDDRFDPQLLDESFVRHVINQSSLLPKNSNPLIKEPTRFECEVCKMVLPHKKSMTEHMKTHWPQPEKKKHLCVICDKKFLHRKSLLIHTRTHTGERPYKCDLCESTFTNRRSLQRHHQNMHQGIVVVKSVQEYAKALTEKKEVEDLDTPMMVNEKLPSVAKRKRKKVTKNMKVSEPLVEHTVDENMKDVSDEAQSDENEDVRLEPAEIILKQAELAAKSICESLFGANNKTSNHNKGVLKKMRKTEDFKESLFSDAKGLSNSTHSIKEEQCDIAKRKQHKHVVNDGYAFLKTALQTVTPGQRVKRTVRNPSFDNKTGHPVDKVIVKSEKITFNSSDSNFPAENEIDSGSWSLDHNSAFPRELHLVDNTQQQAVPNLSKGIQDEYVVLRNALQKSLSNVLETAAHSDTSLTSSSGAAILKQKNGTNRMDSKIITGREQSAPLLYNSGVAIEETEANTSDCESNVSSILRNVLSTEIAATLAPLN